VARGLGQIYGIDLNPFAVAIARFRLLVAGLREAGIERLKDAPAFPLNVATGDSLLHGRRFTPGAGLQGELTVSPAKHLYETEDGGALRLILGQQYHAVVGNPPYITPKDKAANQTYRAAYGSCHMKYALAVPFMERLFELALSGTADGQAAGYVGMITANSFMKREFGKKFVEEVVPQWDLTYLIDTSDAYIPGHGTPTVILFGRNRTPVGPTVRAVLGIRGEPSTPDDPARGAVWTAILSQIDDSGSQGDFVSVTDLPREILNKHPWSLGGGGASELKNQLEDNAADVLSNRIESIGFMAITGEDEIFVATPDVWRREGAACRGFGTGENVRDWGCVPETMVVFPYDMTDSQLALHALEDLGPLQVVFWPFRRNLRNRLMFGKTPEESGLAWFEYRFFAKNRYRTPLSIAFAFVATHNHFVLDRGGKVFNRTAPIIKLAPGSAANDHLVLLGLLNSTAGCFWMKQVMTCKGLGGQGGGIKPEHWHRQYEFDGSKLLRFPIPSNSELTTELATLVDQLATMANAASPGGIIGSGGQLSRKELDAARKRYEHLHLKMVAAQEELDWLVYALYGICERTAQVDEVLECGLNPEERPVEVLLRERIKTGEKTIFYDVHKYRGTPRDSVVTTTSVKSIIAKRIALIRENPMLRLLETLDFKRRWQIEPWESQEERALRSWLLDQLEGKRHWLEIALTSTARIADSVRKDDDFMQVAALYRKNPDFDVAALVAELIEDESVPFLPVYRYKPSGRLKRKQWEEMWAAPTIRPKWPLVPPNPPTNLRSSRGMS
jgi:hypothetical protein